MALAVTTAVPSDTEEAGAHTGRHAGRPLFVINSLAGGGAERVFTRIVNESIGQHNDRDIHVALLDEEPEAYEIDERIQVHRLNTARSLISGVHNLGSLIEQIKPSVIISFLTRANVVSITAGRLTRTPVVISERVATDAHLPKTLGGIVARGLVRATYPAANATIAVSREIGADLTRRFKVAPNRVHTIYNPVDVAAIQVASRKGCPSVPGPYVMAMGRLVPPKNFALLISAYAEANPSFQLVIAGEGPEREKLERRAIDLGIASRVTFLGFLRNPFAALAHARAFILPSNVEGFPNSLVEALALGRPVVAANSPTGPAEILAGRLRADMDEYVETECGILFEPNRVDLLTQALKRLEDDQVCSSLSDGARRRAGGFSVETALAEYWSVIDRVAQG